jgi:hypothetical protein
VDIGGLCCSVTGSLNYSREYRSPLRERQERPIDQKLLLFKDVSDIVPTNGDPTHG